MPLSHYENSISVFYAVVIQVRVLDAEYKTIRRP